MTAARKRKPAVGESTVNHLEELKELLEIYGDPREPEGKLPDPAHSVRTRINEGKIRVTGLAKSDRKFKAESSVERIASQTLPPKEPGGKRIPKLDAAQVEAAKKYYICAVAYGALGRVPTVDFSKEVFGGGTDGGAEWLEDQKRKYIGATRLITKRYSQPMLAILLEDATLTQAGEMCGYKGKDAGAPMLPILQDTLDRLAGFFGLVGKKGKST